METHHRIGFGPAGVIFCAFFTFAAMAYPGTYFGGSGTAANPYKISTVADWQELIATSADWGKEFILLNDIDFGGVNLTPVAPDTIGQGYGGVGFRGVFDGKGHVLRNAVMNLPDQDYVGLFGCLYRGGLIQNLGIEDIAVTGDDRVGGLCGYNLDGLIQTCYTTGDVSGFSFVGGLCGANSRAISECYATGNVSAENGIAGGLCGDNDSGQITGCYASGRISGDSELGGLCGENDGTLQNCYATGEVIGNLAIGGLAGVAYSGTISLSYSTGKVNGNSYIGGLIGYREYDTLTACFWDTQASGQDQGVGEGSSAGVTGKMTAEMKTQATFTSAGWDFVGESANGTADVWRMGADGAGYPWLAWEPGQTNPEIPCMTLSSKRFVFVVNQAGVNPPDQSLTLTRTCDGPGNWVIKVDDSCVWLSVRHVFGEFDPPSNKEYLSIDASGLAKGQYFGSLTVTIRDSHAETSERVDVELNVGVDQPSVYGGGTGTAEDPYQIWTAGQMNAIGAHHKDWDKHFALMADLDMSPYTGWDLNLIGEERYFWLWGAFSGTFDGRGHTLSGLTISKGCFVVGLFRGIVENGVVRNLGLISPTVVVSSDCGGDPVVSDAGILAGTVEPGGRIENCWIENGSVEGGNSVGCLAGYNGGAIVNCRVSGSVKGLVTVGGLVGSNWGEISNCYSECTVQGTSTVGGLAGNNSSWIFNCYSTGAVSGDELAGGLVGSSGLDGFVVNSYWDLDTSGQASSAGGSGLTTELMQNKSYFLDWVRWDFTEESSNGTEDIWRMCADGVDYPRLAWEFARRGDFACPDGTALEDLAMMSFDWTASGIRIYSGGDATGDGRIDLADLAVVAAHWLSEGRQDPLEYEVKACRHDLIPPPGELRFSATVEGRYLHFSDLIVANCCVDRIELTSVVSDGVILLHERELMENLCTCICTFPTTAVLGPFEPGIYTLKVVQSDNYFNHEPYVLGMIEVTIE
jgi:hypothetical protein